MAVAFDPRLSGDVQAVPGTGFQLPRLSFARQVALLLHVIAMIALFRRCSD
ncbi:MAG TPA: hypothetical protein GX507_04485 [Clostridia bacterium]|nr:hypothetical protein [Clostridia bacterium]